MEFDSGMNLYTLRPLLRERSESATFSTFITFLALVGTWDEILGALVVFVLAFSSNRRASGSYFIDQTLSESFLFLGSSMAGMTAPAGMGCFPAAMKQFAFFEKTKLLNRQVQIHEWPSSIQSNGRASHCLSLPLFADF